jgi:transposase
VAGASKYPDELRERAVRLYRAADPKPGIRGLARQLNVPPETLRSWIRQDEADRGERVAKRREMPSAERRIYNGRAVINRAELVRQLGVGLSTAQSWYRERKANGHPEPVLVDGQRLFFDEEGVLRWARAWLLVGSGPAQLMHDGRLLINRAELSRLTGIGEEPLGELYARRDETGHPEAVFRHGRRLYFDRQAALDWDRRRREDILAVLTVIDRSGDPAELVDTNEATRILGYASRSAIDNCLLYRPGYFPDPDAVEPRRWRRDSVWRFADRRCRPGAGGLDGARAAVHHMHMHNNPGKEAMTDTTATGPLRGGPPTPPTRVATPALALAGKAGETYAPALGGGDGAGTS